MWTEETELKRKMFWTSVFLRVESHRMRFHENFSSHTKNKLQWKHWDICQNFENFAFILLQTHKHDRSQLYITFLFVGFSFSWRSRLCRGKSKLNTHTGSVSFLLSDVCLLKRTIALCVRFIDRPEQRLSLDDFKSFLLDSQKVKKKTKSLLSGPFCHIQPAAVWFDSHAPVHFWLCVNLGNVGHGQQQGAGVHVRLPERPPERSGAALLPPRRGACTLPCGKKKPWTCFCQLCFPPPLLPVLLVWVGDAQRSTWMTTASACSTSSHTHTHRKGYWLWPESWAQGAGCFATTSKKRRGSCCERCWHRLPLPSAALCNTTGVRASGTLGLTIRGGKTAQEQLLLLTSAGKSIKWLSAENIWTAGAAGDSLSLDLERWIQTSTLWTKPPPHPRCHNHHD